MGVKKEYRAPKLRRRERLAKVAEGGSVTIITARTAPGK